MNEPEKPDYGHLINEDRRGEFGAVPPSPPVQRGPVVAKPTDSPSQKSQPVKSAPQSGQK